MHIRPMSKLFLADVQLTPSRFDLRGGSSENGHILRLSHARKYGHACAYMHPHIWYKRDFKN
jgi:hypothetical protein